MWNEPPQYINGNVIVFETDFGDVIIGAIRTTTYVGNTVDEWYYNVATTEIVEDVKHIVEYEVWESTVIRSATETDIFGDNGLIAKMTRS